MPLIVKFGDIFRYREEEYAYLAQNGEIIYAAKILDKEKTDQVLKLCDKQYKYAPNNEKIKSNVLYSFVMLSTDEFKDRMAHFEGTDKNNIEPSFDIIGSLNEKDLKAVKHEILDRSSAVPLKLKDMVRDIDIKS